MSEQDYNEKNHIIVCVSFEFIKNQREVYAAIINLDKRQIHLSEFSDEEHYSNFESLILQTSPSSNDEKYTLYIKFPELESEREKLEDIIQTSGVACMEKQKKDFKAGNIESDLDKILKTPLAQHIVESTMTQSLITLHSIVVGMKLHEEQSNFKAFSLSQHILSQFMKLDLAAINALLIFPKQNEMKNIANQGNCGTLMELLDKCKTQIGSRTLKRWLKQPLQDEEQINHRLDMVEMFINMNSFLKYLQDEFFKKVADLDKLYAKFYRVHSKKSKHGCSLADVIKVYQLIRNIKAMLQYVEQSQIDVDQYYGKVINEFIVSPLVECLEDFSKLEDMISQAIDLDKAKTTSTDYQVNPRFSQSLQEINKSILKCQKRIDNLTEETSNDLGISVKQVESTSHLYLFEAKKKEADEAFRKKSGKKYKTITVKKAQISFTSTDLQAECAELQSLQDEYASESKEVIEKLLSVVATYYPAMERSSVIISELDVFGAFATLSINSNGYTKPKIGSKIQQITLIDSKHACLDAMDSGCIANDCVMNTNQSRFHIITGPNMGGKSTYIRQVAICVLLAHIGCYVPAEKAEIPIIDAVITRVGASDMQLRGISTFMSEMLEASCMLKIATKKSLIIIDELGRGTSTSEGFGLAWAISQYIVEQIGCFCLFATHFHEMIKMADQLEGVKNYHVTCVTNDNKLTMQYKVKEGFAERSYGLYVAEILEFPEQILDDASEKLAELENFGGDQPLNLNVDQMQVENSINDKDYDLIQLSKGANKEQREKVILLTQQYSRQLSHTSDKNVQQEIIGELRNKVIQVLQNQ